MVVKPKSFKEYNVKHMARHAEIFILKRVQSWENRDPTQTEKSQFALDYREFLTGINPLLKWNSDFKRFMLVASSHTPSSFGSVVSSLVSNTDVKEVSVSRTLSKSSTAHIVLQNPNRKYLFQNDEIQKSRCIILPNDEIIIRLPNWDGNLNMVFTGFVDTADAVEQGINNYIEIKCTDVLKRLKESRSNVRPSATMKEAGTSIVPFTIPWADMLPHDVIALMLTRIYCNYSTITDSAYLNTLKFLSKGLANNSLSPENVAISKNRLRNKYVNTFQTRIGSTDVIDKDDKTVTIPRAIEGYKTESGNNAREPKDMVFEITGMYQPAYTLMMNSSGPEIWQSEWKSNLDIIRGITSPLLFEFFADAFGTIISRPMNVSLRDLAENKDSIYKLKDNEDEQYTISTRSTESDLGILSILYTRGRFKYEPMWAEFLVGYAVDGRLLKRYGARVGPQQTKIGLLNKEACARYARAYLDRINRRSKSVSIQMKGNSEFVPGNPLWLEKENIIYYIEAINHSFIAGSTYNMTLECSYGRRPICWDDTTTTGIAKGDNEKRPEAKSFKMWLDELEKRGEISKDYYVASPGSSSGTTATEISELDYYKAVENELKFDNKLWEPLSEMDYVQIVDDSALPAEVEIAQWKEKENFLDKMTLNAQHRESNRLAREKITVSDYLKNIIDNIWNFLQRWS